MTPRRATLSTFISISIYAVMVLIGLTAAAGGLIMLGRWIIVRTHDPDAEAH